MSSWLLVLLFLIGISTLNAEENSIATWCSWCQGKADMAVAGVRGFGFTTEQGIPIAIDECMNNLHFGQGKCQKIAGILVPYIFDLVRESQFNGQELCAILIPPCSNHFSLPAKDWSVVLPPPGNPTSRRVNRPQKRTLKVLQLTDIHIDPDYAPGSAVNCAPATGPAVVQQFLLCCRGGPAKNGQEAAGYWGTTSGMCDLPYRSFESALRFLQRKGMNFDYILLTGDFSPHDLWEYTKERSTYLLRNVTTTVEAYFPGIPVYLNLGNHEAVPFDAYSYSDEDNSIPQEWLYREMEQFVGKWIPEQDRRELLRHGSYVSYPAPGLKIIHLNNNFCFHFNFFVHLSPQDPGGVLSYLVQELKSAEDAGQLVHIHAHIAPSNNGDCLAAWTSAYMKILRRFRNIIVEQFFGHNHVDRHLIYTDEEGQGMVTGWVAPSLTTWDHVNPAFRTYSVDTETGKVVASSVFHADIDGLSSSEEPSWLETDTLGLYDLPNFSVNSWGTLMRRIETNHSDRFTYISSIFRNSSWIQKNFEEEAAIWLQQAIIHVK